MQMKRKIDQFEKLERDLEGFINDYDGGISEKDETVKALVIYIHKIAINVALGELKRIETFWRKDISSEVYLAINARRTQLTESLDELNR
jgi:N-acetylglutamate synthase/N-acetylornithine aminotransferase